jgi:hypothetical protein
VFDDEGQYLFCRDWLVLKYHWLAGKRVRFALNLVWLGLRHPALALRRLRMALPNWSHNRAFGRFSRQVN